MPCSPSVSKLGLCRRLWPFNCWLIGTCMQSLVVRGSQVGRLTSQLSECCPLVTVSDSACNRRCGCKGGRLGGGGKSVGGARAWLEFASPPRVADGPAPKFMPWNRDDASGVLELNGAPNENVAPWGSRASTPGSEGAAIVGSEKVYCFASGALLSTALVTACEKPPALSGWLKKDSGPSLLLSAHRRIFSLEIGQLGKALK